MNLPNCLFCHSDEPTITIHRMDNPEDNEIYLDPVLIQKWEDASQSLALAEREIVSYLRETGQRKGMLDEWFPESSEDNTHA